MMFMMAMSHVVGSVPVQVLENIAKYSCLSIAFQEALLSRLNPQRDDSVGQAENLVHFVQMTEPTPIFGCMPT